MQKSGGFLALLLVVVILCAPVKSVPETLFISESPQTACGDFASPNENGEVVDSEDGKEDSYQILAVVIVVVIVIFIIYCFSNADNK
jgi:hypothetical protein